MRRYLFILLTIIAFYTAAQIDNSSNIHWEREIDWENNRVEINIRSGLNIKDSTLSSARMKSETWVDDNLTNIFFKNILNIPVDSLLNISEVINRNPEIYYQLDALSESLEPKYSRLTTNLEYLETKYSFPIYPDFLSIFYKNSQHRRVHKKLDHLEYGNYTGLIIYVPKSLPLYQKGKEGEMSRVLLPRIYDEDMNLVMDFTMVEPEYIKKWGMVLYGSSFDESQYQDRVGIAPLRVIAKGLFGKNSSDIIISNREAQKLIGSADNIKIISQSRILIVN